MNCPSRPDDTFGRDGWNQSPRSLAADSTTREDMNGLVNSRLQRDGHRLQDEADEYHWQWRDEEERAPETAQAEVRTRSTDGAGSTQEKAKTPSSLTPSVEPNVDHHRVGVSKEKKANDPSKLERVAARARRLRRTLLKFGKFIGPGFMVAVAYIDPGNYSTDVAAGATFRFRLLFVVLMSNLFAIFLQSLCIKLGSVTGLNLAENCRAHLPKWLNVLLYIFAEAAIIATDIAEVIGSAIALNLLLHVPLVAGCAITLVDVLVILIFYRPSGSFRKLRAFEFFVVAFVLGVVICFCIQLSLIKNTSVADVFRGYLPSSTIVESKGLYLSCGILGATVMPHSLYLGSGIVQTRLQQFESQTATVAPSIHASDEKPKYRPSQQAIKCCLKHSIAELAISLFTFALFVNSSILIVAGAALSGNDGARDADLFAIHDLLSHSLAPVAGTVFALALLLSGTSAGIICTIAGQMVSEGALNWTIAPWLRRLLTRSISITPSIIIAGAVGKDGLSAALNGTQVALSVILPFVSAPLIYFTCRNRYMTVAPSIVDGDSGPLRMRNHWITTALAVAVWLVIVVMNVSLLVLVGLGKA